MKRLLALLLLAVAPAFSQEYTPGPYIPPPLPPGETGNIVYTTVNPPPEGAQFNWSGFINTQSNGGGFSGGNVPGYNPTTGTFMFGYAWGTVTYNIFNSPEWPSSGVNVDGFKYSWEYFNQDMSSGTLSGNIRFFAPDNTLLENFNFTMPATTEGWTLIDGIINFADPYDRSEIGRMQVSFTGKDSRFWAGYYGPQIRDIDVSVLYSSAAPVFPTFLYWDRLAGENELFTLTEPGVVRYGADGVYLYQEFQAGTYACSNGDWGSDPIGGVVKSCSLGSDIPPAVDCAVNPLDPTCIIDDLLDVTDEQPIMFADNGSDDGSSDGTEVIADEEDPAPVEEILAEADPVVEELVEDSLAEESLEELLAEESADEDELDEEVTAVAAIKEMVNEEKASALSDNISKDVLGAALSIAADAVSAATAAGGESASSSTSSDSSSRSTTLTAAASEIVATTTETIAVTESTSETTKEESTESSAVAALDILDTGRQLGQEALSVTLALTEAAATESLSEAESIAAVSSSDSVLASMNSIETAAAVVIEEQQIANNETVTETSTEETAATENTEVVVAENNVEAVDQVTTEVEQKEEVKEEVMVVEVKEQETTEVVKEQEEIVVAEVQQEQTSDVTVEREETIVADVSTQQTTETVTEQREEVIVAETVTETAVENVEQVVAEVQSEQQSSAVEFTTVEQAMEVFASNVNQQTAAEQEELENNIVQQAIASSQSNEEENKIGFAEAEAITIASDPALANAFNVQPNTASLELLGVLGSRAEEKSDAELRAEQVVAANKEQQDAINANYMDADQSGIVAAIGADADVSSYLSQRLTDVPFYKPEDIYKNIVYKDNVRGAYFLEKGNTDTYKKMVEEQIQR